MAEGILPAQSAAPMKGLTNHYAEDLAYFLEVSLKPLGLEKQEKKSLLSLKCTRYFANIIVFIIISLRNTAMCVFTPVLLIRKLRHREESRLKYKHQFRSLDGGIV